MNWNDGIFHLSVNAEGLVSLWDREADARAQKDETYVALPLNDRQHLLLRDAQQASAQKAVR